MVVITTCQPAEKTGEVSQGLMPVEGRRRERREGCSAAFSLDGRGCGRYGINRGGVSPISYNMDRPGISGDCRFSRIPGMGGAVYTGIVLKRARRWREGRPIGTRA